MGIRANFATKWSDARAAAVKLGDSDIDDCGRILVTNRNVGPFVFGQHIIIFDGHGDCALITSRFRTSLLALPALLHTWEQRKRLRSAGISTYLGLTNGRVTCTYAQEGWVEKNSRRGATV